MHIKRKCSQIEDRDEVSGKPSILYLHILNNEYAWCHIAIKIGFVAFLCF